MNAEFELFKLFIEKHCFADIEKLNLHSDIEDDLLLMGDDAIDFILAYSKEYNVDVSQFMAADYISTEGGHLLLKHTFRRFFRNQYSTRKKLTIEHLLNGIVAGKLDESIITS